MNIHFLTFASKPMLYDRIKQEAIQSKLFQTITCLDQYDLDKNFQKILIDRINKYQNPKYKNRGYGYWSWKPYIILKKLNDIEFNDILFYTDCGTVLNINQNTIEKINELIINVNKHEIMLTQLNGKFNDIFYTTNKLYKKFCEYFNINSEIFKNKLVLPQYQATLVICKKTLKVLEIIQKWNNFIQNNFEYITDQHNDDNYNINNFIENRHDQSVLSLLAKIYNITPINNIITYNKNWKNLLDKSPIIFARLKYKI